MEHNQTTQPDQQHFATTRRYLQQIFIQFRPRGCKAASGQYEVHVHYLIINIDNGNAIPGIMLTIHTTARPPPPAPAAKLLGFHDGRSSGFYRYVDIISQILYCLFRTFNNTMHLKIYFFMGHIFTLLRKNLTIFLRSSGFLFW